MSFIDSHLLKIIKDLILSKKKDLGDYDGFLYLDSNIIIDNFSEFCYNKTICIDRIYLKPYVVDSATPMSWHQIKGYDLVRILNILRTNKFHIYKNIEGSRVKVRL